YWVKKRLLPEAKGIKGSPGAPRQRTHHGPWRFFPPDQSIVLRKPIGIRKRYGTMEVGALNRSIPIHCDGLYLVVLKGTVTLKKAEDPLILRAYSQPGRDFLVVNCSSQMTEVEKLVVHKFHSQDEIFLEYKPNNPDSQENSSQDLTLSLVMLTPRSYCSPDH
uniref:Uncharacterized protein n=1 Tax=Varanus komodoensis TaxID=61221 RepID=A0A8D2Q575_VARKO